MAIVYTSKPNVNRLINAFNNNVFEFADNGSKTAKKCTVLINNSTSIVITPINNKFYFNLKEMSSLISKEDNWQDNTPNVLGVSSDADIVRNLIIKFTITFTDTTTVNNQSTYSILRSVSQINNLIDIATNEFSRDFLALKYLTFFKGYPFDFSFYLSHNPKQTSVFNLKTNYYNLFDPDLNSSRFFLSNNLGNLLQDINVNKILENGLNVVYFSFLQEDINIKLVDNCSGVYLKWVNEFGSFSYWLFSSIYTSTINARIKDEFNVDFKDIRETSATTLITGKDGGETVNLNYKNLDTNEIAQLQSILTSPRVELYNGTVDSVALWQTVIVRGGSFTWTNTKRELANISIQIIKNKYTQV